MFANRLPVRRSVDRLSFDLPLQTSLMPRFAAGSYTPTFTRATTATVTDFEGLLRTAKIGEARFEGARRVENLAPSSEGAAGWSVGTGHSLSLDNSAGVPNGCSNVVKMSAAAGSNASYHRVTILGTGGSGIVHMRAFVKKGTYRYVGMRPGTFAADNLTDVVFDLDTLTFSNTSIVTNYGYKSLGEGWYLIWGYASLTNVTEARYAGFSLPNNLGHESWAKSGTETVYITGMQVEKADGQANQNPSEYVSNGVLSAPYHGAGVDGVKYFDTYNGNTVTNNVVTEAQGAAIPDSTLHGYLAEGQRINLLLNSAAPVTQDVAVTAQAYTISMYGTGTCTLSGTGSGVLTGTGATERVQLTFTPTAGTLTLTFAGTNTKGQLEAGAFASSYIPTGAGSVTRNADVLNYNTLLNIKSDRGVFYCEFATEWTGAPVTTYRLLGKEAGAGGADIAIRSSKLQFYDGVDYYGDKALLGSNSIQKIAMLWNLTYSKGIVSGSADSNKSFDGALDIKPTMYIASYGGTGFELNGTIRNVKIWKNALKDSKLIKLTS